MAIMPLVLVPGRYVGRANYRVRMRVQEKLSEASAYMQEVLGIFGILLVKAFTNPEPALDHRLADLQAPQLPVQPVEAPDLGALRTSFVIAHRLSTILAPT